MNIYQNGRKISEGKYRQILSSGSVQKIEADGLLVGELEEKVQTHEGFLIHKGIAVLPSHLRNLLDAKRVNLESEFALQLAGLTDGKPGDYNIVYQGHVYRVEVREKKPGQLHGPDIPTTTVTSFRTLR